MDSKVEVEKGGDVEDAIAADHGPGEVGVTRFGIRLHPQPTADALDPLNWPSLQKHTILGIVMMK